MVLPPEICEAAESESFDIEKILHAPNSGELHRHLAVRSASVGSLVIDDILAENLEVQCILEIFAVDEPVETSEEGVVDVICAIYSAVVLHMKAERSEFAVLPEIQAACNLEISSAWCFVAILLFCLVVIVNEEECVTPFVPIEAFKGSGNLFTITAEVVKIWRLVCAFVICENAISATTAAKKVFFNIRLFV